MGAMVSPLHGADGNVEFLLHARVGPVDRPELGDEALDSLVVDAQAGET